MSWAVRKGRAAILADCGMGKTPMEFAWSDTIARHSGRRVLILTPLAVAAQSAAEAEKFGVDAARSHRGELPDAQIVIANYERLHLFDPAQFGGVVLDESSILKAFDGARRSQITQFMRHIPYRLLATATAAPNDYTELGTSSEALGYLGHVDMLTRFFKNQNNTVAQNRMRGQTAKWEFRGHSEEPFWRWVTSWARAARRPSDLGFDDGAFALPPLREIEHVVASAHAPEGMLFALPAVTMREQREERRRTILERCERLAAICDHQDQSLVWCHLNAEGDHLAKMIPGVVQVSGADPDERKEEVFTAFARGEVRALVTKPKIGAWGLNFQRCAHVATFPSHSYEQYYQSIRRCWRFGQTREVKVDIVTTEGEQRVLANMQRKAAAAEAMFERLVTHMHDAMTLSRRDVFPQQSEPPKWLASIH